MKPKPLTRPSELVLSAIYNLDEENGSSPQEIVNYIADTYGITSNEIKQKVDAALKRGLSFGLISRDSCGLYKLRDIHELPEVEQEVQPQKVVKRKRKLAKPKRDSNFKNPNNQNSAKVEGPRKKKKENNTSERQKKMKLDAGECSGKGRNPGLKLETSFGCTNLSTKKKMSKF